MLLSFTIKQLKELNFKDFFKRLYDKAFNEEDLMSAAAQVAFYFAFSLFPLLLFLISLFGLVLESAADLRAEMFYYLRQVMPVSAYELVNTTIEEVTQNSSGSKLTFGFLIAIWSASAGVDSIRIALNGVYNLTEKRAWWKTKLLSLSITLGLGVLLTIALAVIFYGGKVISLVLSYVNLPISSPFVLGVLQAVVILLVLAVVFALIYNYLPKHKKKYKWVWVTPGAIISIFLWLLLSYAFRLYLGYFNSYDKTYGSLGAVIILMLWLYLTALVILIGGTINAALQEFTDPETAKAGEIKAAAKEIVENPNAKSVAGAKAKLDDKIDGSSKAETNPANIGDVSESKKPKKSDEETIEEKPVNKKSALKLVAGLVIGFFTQKNKN